MSNTEKLIKQLNENKEIRIKSAQAPAHDTATDILPDGVCSRAGAAVVAFTAPTESTEIMVITAINIKNSNISPINKIAYLAILSKVGFRV